LVEERLGQDPEITASAGQTHDFINVGTGFAELLE
jgi:hypothetical protein